MTTWQAACSIVDTCLSQGVREFVVANARYWIDEYRLDGLRLDATQQIFDDSESHILSEIEQAVQGAVQSARLKGDETFPVKVTLEIPSLGVKVPFDGEIKLR